MPHYRDDHERLLTWVMEQRWQAFSSGDEGLLKAFVYGGFILAKAVPEHPGKMRLMLTRRGEHYLRELRERDRNEQAPPVFHGQRETDLPPPALPVRSHSGW